MLINRPLPTHYRCLPPPLTPSVKNMNVEGEYFKIFFEFECRNWRMFKLDLPLCCHIRIFILTIFFFVAFIGEEEGEEGVGGRG
jgi:hypothetical protein